MPDQRQLEFRGEGRVEGCIGEDMQFDRQLRIGGGQGERQGSLEVPAGPGRDDICQRIPARCEIRPARIGQDLRRFSEGDATFRAPSRSLLFF